MQSMIELTKWIAVASGGGGKGAPAPPGPFKPDTSSLWMDLFSLECYFDYSHLQLFASFIFEVDFSALMFAGFPNQSPLLTMSEMTHPLPSKICPTAEGMGQAIPSRRSIHHFVFLRRRRRLQKSHFFFSQNRFRVE